jgi:hypothetical protein
MATIPIPESDSAAISGPFPHSLAPFRTSGEWTFAFHDRDKVLREKVYENPELGSEVPACAF